jgi:transcription elongation GreA/GreB family factor
LRDLRAWTAQRETVEVSLPEPGSDVVRFGMTVTLLGEDGKRHVWRIVGEEKPTPRTERSAMVRQWRRRCSAKGSASR